MRLARCAGFKRRESRAASTDRWTRTNRRKCCVRCSNHAAFPDEALRAGREVAAIALLSVPVTELCPIRDAFRSPAGPASARFRRPFQLTAQARTAIIFCCPPFLSLPHFGGYSARLNRSARFDPCRHAALVTAYGCGKEEPKKVEAPATAAAPAMPEAHSRDRPSARPAAASPTSARTTRTAPAWRSTSSTPRASTIGGKKVKFELVAEDDQADPKQGTAVAQQAGRRQGQRRRRPPELRAPSIPASKIYSDAGIPQISPSATNPKFTRQGFKTTFRVVADDVQLGGTLGKLRRRGR